MSVHDAVESIGFKSGDFVGKRSLEGTYVDGIYVPTIPTAFNFSASLQPLTGHDLKILGDGYHSENTRKLYTQTLLKTSTPSEDPDRIVIDGEEWEVKNVAHHSGLGGIHYKVLVTRQPIP